MRLYASYDRAAGIYSSPICCVNDYVAMRQFKQYVSTGEASYCAPDLDLYCLGSYNELSGVIEPFAPELVIRATDFNDVKE